MGALLWHLDVPVKLVRLITVLAMIFGLFFFILGGLHHFDFLLWIRYRTASCARSIKRRAMAICWPPWMPNWPPVNSVCVKWSGM